MCRGVLVWKSKMMSDQKKPLDQISEYRVLCLRDRFPDPVPNLRLALECLLSGEAYMPESTGEIVACLKDGRSVEIPREFFIVWKPRFESRETAEAWIKERMTDIDAGRPMAKLRGALLANPDDPVEKQIDDAFASRFPRLVGRELIDTACERALDWLRYSVSLQEIRITQFRSGC